MDEEEAPYTVPPQWSDWWHIDGFPSLKGTNTNRLGVVVNFTLLLGILLSDVRDEHCGSLTVYPGSHQLIGQYISQLPGGMSKLLDGAGFEGLERFRRAIMNDVRFPPAQQLRFNAGDIVLAHYALAHAIAPNCSPNVRYCVYFRLHHAAHPIDTPRPEALANIWLEFEGVHEIVK